MKSSTTPSFWRAFDALPTDIQKSAEKAYKLWRRNPSHPSLRFERKGEYWSGRGWRALARNHNGTLYWFWIGPHDQYERIIRG